ncbi:MAG: AAA family ATPase [Janthinobacterium lividum]
MLKRLHLTNFTVFADAEFEFGPGLNVLVGTNGTGKTHVLKAGYVMLWSSVEAFSERLEFFTDAQSKPDFRGLFDFKLKNVLQSQSFSSDDLIKFGSEPFRAGINIQGTFGVEKIDVSMDINPPYTSIPAVKSFDILTQLSFANELTACVFIPAKEVLTSGWLFFLYNRREIPIDETYPDLLRLLFGPPLRQPKPAHIVEKIARLIGGKVEEDNGRFYLAAPNQPRMEMNLVAEGMRKFATLYKLLANGTLTPETTLFWDEPEANLNPALLKEMAAVLTDLAQAGFQVILATHSLFLLKELHMLAQERKAPVRYFGLSAQPGEAVTVATADNLELLPDIVALDAELEQSDRFQRILDQADADRS